MIIAPSKTCDHRWTLWARDGRAVTDRRDCVSCAGVELRWIDLADHGDARAQHPSQPGSY